MTKVHAPLRRGAARSRAAADLRLFLGRRASRQLSRARPHRPRRRTPADDLVSASAAAASASWRSSSRSRADWIAREQAVERLNVMLAWLERTHLLSRPVPAFPQRPHRRDDCPSAARTTAATSSRPPYLFQGLLCARQYLRRDTPAENASARSHPWLWRDVEWSWHTRERPQGADLALEPQQRLEPRRRHARLERMPDRLCSRRRLADLFHRR